MGFLTSPRTVLRQELERTRLGRLNPTGKLVFQDDFSQGLSGWELLEGESIQISQGQGLDQGDMALGLFGPHSLMLQTRDSAGSLARAIKRLTIQELGKIGWELWYVWKAASESNVRNVRFTFDIQDPSGSALYWPGILYRNYESSAYHRKWQYQSGPRSARVWTDIPDAAQNITWNMWGRYNWNYLKLIIDLDNKEYVSLQSNDQLFDLSGLAIATEAADPTLYGLLNPMITITADSAARCFLWMQRPTLTIDER